MDSVEAPYRLFILYPSAPHRTPDQSDLQRSFGHRPAPAICRKNVDYLSSAWHLCTTQVPCNMVWTCCIPPPSMHEGFCGVSLLSSCCRSMLKARKWACFTSRELVGQDALKSLLKGHPASCQQCGISPHVTSGSACSDLPRANRHAPQQASHSKPRQ